MGQVGQAFLILMVLALSVLLIVWVKGVRNRKEGRSIDPQGEEGPFVRDLMDAHKRSRRTW